MPLFRKKPVTIEAVQWTGANTDEVTRFVGGSIVETTDPNIVGGRGLVISTLEGDMVAIPRDWIIRGIQGEFYPCKPDIFQATYEPSYTAPAITDAMIEAFGRAWEATPAGEPGARRRAGLAAALATVTE